MGRIGILLMTLLVLVSFAEGSQTCWTSRERDRHNKVTSNAECNMPLPRLVPIPVPDGYEWVYPSAVKINRCDGHICKPYNHQCLSLENRTMTYKIQAFKRGTFEDLLCTDASVEEHLSCECTCPLKQEICRQKNMVFNEGICMCECDAIKEQQCQNHIRKMWDKNICKCVCNNNNEECGGGTKWNEEDCKCVSIAYEWRKMRNGIDYKHHRQQYKTLIPYDNEDDETMIDGAWMKTRSSRLFDV